MLRTFSLTFRSSRSSSFFPENRNVFLLRFKLVAYPPERDDHVPVRAEVIAQVFNMRIYRPVIAEKIISPYIMKELVP